MKKRIKLLLALSTSALLLTACNVNKNSVESLESTSNTPVASSSKEEVVENKQVSRQEWENFFSFENMSFHSNYKLSVSVPQNEWEATISFDNGKQYVTGIGLQSVPPEEEPIEQRPDEYIHMKSLNAGVATYDRYYYWNVWKKEERQSSLENYYLGFGIFEYSFDDFEYDAAVEEYVIKASSTFITSERFDSVRIKFSNQKPSQQIMVSKGMEMIYTYSEYNNVSVVFPTVA